MAPEQPQPIPRFLAGDPAHWRQRAGLSSEALAATIRRALDDDSAPGYGREAFANCSKFQRPTGETGHSRMFA